jgi:methionyl-tRNA formyltransferase
MSYLKGGVKMRIVYAGTPQVAVDSLSKLADVHEVVAVLTRPDARVGRKSVLVPSPVKALALERGIPVYESVDALLDFVAKLPDSQRPSIGIAVAYGELLKSDALNAFEFGWLNLHFSLLPKWRGAAPVQHAILNGDYKSGISIFKLQPGLDDGPLLLQHPYEIGTNMTASQALEGMSALGANSLVEALEIVADVQQQAQSLSELLRNQVGEVTLAPKLLKSDARINWEMPALEIVQQINAYSANPGAWFELLQLGKENLRIVALQAELDNSSGVNKVDQVKLLRVKPAGKSEMAYSDWVNGLKGDYEFV